MIESVRRCIVTVIDLSGDDVAQVCGREQNPHARGTLAIGSAVYAEPRDVGALAGIASHADEEGGDPAGTCWWPEASRTEYLHMPMGAQMMTDHNRSYKVQAGATDADGYDKVLRLERGEDRAIFQDDRQEMSNISNPTVAVDEAVGRDTRESSSCVSTGLGVERRDLGSGTTVVEGKYMPQLSDIVGCRCAVALAYARMVANLASSTAERWSFKTAQSYVEATRSPSDHS